jgi:hypothetical protein
VRVPRVPFVEFLQKSFVFREDDFVAGPELLLVFSQPDQKASPSPMN